MIFTKFTSKIATLSQSTRTFRGKTISITKNIPDFIEKVSYNLHYQKLHMQNLLALLIQNATFRIVTSMKVATLVLKTPSSFTVVFTQWYLLLWPQTCTNTIHSVNFSLVSTGQPYTNTLKTGRDQKAAFSGFTICWLPTQSTTKESHPKIAMGLVQLACNYPI